MKLLNWKMAHFATQAGQLATEEKLEVTEKTPGEFLESTSSIS
jgi:hypothetical protein